MLQVDEMGRFEWQYIVAFYMGASHEPYSDGVCNG